MPSSLPNIKAGIPSTKRWHEMRRKTQPWTPSQLGELGARRAVGAALAAAKRCAAFKAHLDIHPEFELVATLGLLAFEEAYNEALESGEDCPRSLADFIRAHGWEAPSSFAARAEGVADLPRAYAEHLVGHMLTRVSRARVFGPAAEGYGTDFVQSLRELDSHGPVQSALAEWAREAAASRAALARLAEAVPSRVEAARIDRAIEKQKPSAGRGKTARL